MEPRSRAHAVLTIRGVDLDPASIAERLGVGPTSAGRKGDIRRPGAAPARIGWYSIDVRVDNLDEVDQAVRSAVEKVTQSDEWDAVRASFEMELTLVFYLYETNVGAGLGSSTLQMLAANGIGLDFDLYALAGTGS